MIATTLDNSHRARDVIGEYLRVFARRKFIIAIPTIAAVAIACLFAAARPKLYSADAVIAFDARRIQVIEIKSVVSGLPQESPALRTELDILTSRSMAETVLDRLDLAHNEDFLHEIEGPHSPIARITALFQRITGWPASEGAGSGEATGELPIALTRANMIDWLLDGLQVSNDGRSFTIFVTFVSQSPELSALVANAFATAYLDGQIELKEAAARDASDWLRRRLEQMRSELEASEAAVIQFQRNAGLMETKGGTLDAQQVSELNSQLVLARSERLRAEAQAKTVRQLAGNGSVDLSGLSDVASPTILALRSELAQVNAKLDTYRDRGAFRHPEAIALDSQAASLNRQLATEIQRALKGIEADAAAARRKEADLEGVLRAKEGQRGVTSQASVRLNQLQREADANRTIYEEFLNRYKQTIEQESLATADGRLISRAEPPEMPFGPRRMPLIVLGFIVGSGIGTGLALLLERLNQSVRLSSEIEEMTGIPVVGVIPLVRGWRTTPEQYVLNNPRSLFSDALHRVYAAFHLSRVDQEAVKVLMVTSATASEGKTSFCVSLARSLAMRDLRVLVIDADMHRARVASAFGAQVEATISDVVSGHVSLEQAVRRDNWSSAHFLSARPENDDPNCVLRSAGLKAMIDRSRLHYDLVIIDTPPVLAATDAALVGALSDANLFLVRWGKTPRQAVTAALRFLDLCRITVDGMVVTQADIRRDAQYTHVYDSTYHGPRVGRTFPRPGGGTIGGLPATIDGSQRTPPSMRPF